MKAFGIEKVKRECAKVKVFKLSIKPNFAQKQPRHNQGKRKKFRSWGKHQSQHIEIVLLNSKKKRALSPRWERVCGSMQDKVRNISRCHVPS